MLNDPTRAVLTETFILSIEVCPWCQAKHEGVIVWSPKGEWPGPEGTPAKAVCPSTGKIVTGKLMLR